MGIQYGKSERSLRSALVVPMAALLLALRLLVLSGAAVRCCGHAAAGLSQREQRVRSAGGDRQGGASDSGAMATAAAANHFTLITNTIGHCQREVGIEQTHHLYKGRP